MELRQLRHFLAVVDCGGFSRAADHFGKSQQALSKSIQALEDALGVRLLERHPKFASLTIFGQMLIPYARRIDADSTAFRNQLAASQRAERGHVRLGAGPAAATLLVTEALLRLASERPDLHVFVEAGIYGTMAPKLLANELDVFVCIDNEDEVARELAKVVLLQDEYRVIASASHPLANATGVTATMLGEYSWILGTTLGEIERSWRAAFEHELIPPPQPVFATNSIEFSKYALQSSNYLTILPVQIIESELDAGTLCCIETNDFRWLRPIALHYRASVELRPATVVVIDCLQKAATKLQKLVRPSAATA